MHYLPLRCSALLAMLVFCCSACTPLATYPTEGKGEALVPWMYPVPQVMAMGLAESYEKTVPAGSESEHPLVFNLPPGVSEGVWNQVAIDSRIEGARPATEEDFANGTMIWTVERVAVRGLKAKVDVIYQSGRVHQLSIVSLAARPLELFHVTAFQRLLINVPTPNLNRPSEASDAELAASDGQEANSDDSATVSAEESQD
ncbi:MAG: hypothetical protein MK085_05320 [Phycisphaerales bacterium]|nr:hypothetical protein [Phycisphaerales bacterium]